MWFGVVSILPGMLDALRGEGVFGRGLKSQQIQLEAFNPRDFAVDRHRTVDDKPYGGGPGMVMMVEPALAAIRAAQSHAPPGTPVVLLSPRGSVFSQARAVEVATNLPGLILVCGRFEGLDERLMAHIDQEWSIGDYVLSGGELAAMVVADAIARHIPGVLGNLGSNIDESHLDATLEYPQYTRPESLDDGARVPATLLSGNHTTIGQFRRREALAVTYERRPELLVGRTFNEADRALLKELFEPSRET